MSTEAIEIMQNAQVPAEKPAPLAVADARHISQVEAPPKLGIAPPTFAAPRTIADLKVMGEMMAASGFFKDVKTASQAMVKIVAGAALGYDPVTSMNAFHIIEGKLTLTAGEVGARVKRSGKYNYRVKQLDDSLCTLIFMERDGKTWMDMGDSTFTKQDAIVAGLMGKDVWKKYFRNMSLSRALTNGCRWFCPDLFGGPVYTPEELGAEVDIVDGEMVVVGELQEPAKGVVAADRKPLTAVEVRALYEDARKVDSTLPEDPKLFTATVIEGYDGKRNLKPKEMLALEDRVREILANGATAPESNRQKTESPPVAPIAPPPPATVSHEAAPAVEVPMVALTGEYEDPAPQNTPETTPESAQVKPEAAAPPVEPPAPPDAPGASYGPAPGNDGEPMTKSTQGRLFAILGQLGYKGKARHSWCESMGVEVPRDESGEPTFGALREPLAKWLADRAADELRLLKMKEQQMADAEAECEVCGYEGGAHSETCPEANPPR